MRQILDQKIVELEKSFELTIKKNSEQQKEQIEQLRKTIETKFSITNHKKNSFVRMGTMLPDEDSITNESISPLRRMSSVAFSGLDKRRSNFAQSRGRMSNVSMEPTQVSPYSIKAEIERMNNKSEKNFKAIVQDEVASI